MLNLKVDLEGEFGGRKDFFSSRAGTGFDNGRGIEVGGDFGGREETVEDLEVILGHHCLCVVGEWWLTADMQNAYTLSVEG